MVPVIALVGRPNVGKSTLFNRLTKSRDAIVAEYAGLTRDRQYGEARWQGRTYIVIDTGGISGDEEGIDAKMAEQSLQAIEEADAVLFLVDSRAGMTAADQMIAEHLRKRNKRSFLIANKVDTIDPDLARAEFSPLGLGDALPIAAAHGRGINHMLQEALGIFPKDNAEEEGEGERRGRRRRGTDPDSRSQREGRDQDRHHRPAQRGQVDPGQPHARRRAGDRLRPGRHHPRQHLHPVRAQRGEVHPDRHRWRAAPRQDLRGGGKVLGGEDPPGDPGRQRGDLRHGRPRRGGRARPQPARLRPRDRPCPGHRPEQVGWHGGGRA